MRLTAPVLLALATQIIACGSSDAKSGVAGKGGVTAADAGGEGSCGIKSGYVGDDLCIPAPSPEDGIQIHVGPASYDSPADVAPYLIQPSEETVDCFNAAIPDSNFYYLAQKNRMRPSSHHMLIYVNNPTDTGGQVGPAPTGCDISNSIASIPGSQTPSRDFPAQLGDEDKGLGRFLPQSSMASFQLHYINSTEVPVLREAWVNLYKKPAAEVTQALQAIFMVGDIAVNIPPQTRQTTTLQYTPPLTSETRVFEVNAHMHSHAETFTLTRVRAGQEQVMYQSFNWEEPYENTFNSVVKNPAPDAVAKRDGGLSGDYFMEPGDTFKWSCDVNNTLDTAIHFANEATTAEMCMLVGSYVGTADDLMSGFCANGQCSGQLGLKKQ